jgi:glutathione synthase/RimK-type ligase-like ATP-grasp enzyme
VGAERHIGLATWSGLPELDPDDRLLLPLLRGAGCDVRPVVWSDPAVDWPRFDLVIVRSTWDYYRRYAEFLAWLARAGRQTHLWNPPVTLRWNTHKGYLRDLARSGIRVIPTIWGSDGRSLATVVAEVGWKELVLKPAVSAAGTGAVRFDASEAPARQALFERMLSEGEVLVQPYVGSVETLGERSLVFLDGEFSHAVLRAPKLSAGSALREGAPVVPSAAELEVARKVLATYREETLYARVDLALDASDRPMLMELELTEPLLYLASSPGAAERFAAGIRRRLE